jgi:hypothetical protein
MKKIYPCRFCIIDGVAVAMLIVGTCVLVVAIVAMGVAEVQHRPGPDIALWWFSLFSFGAIEFVAFVLLYARGWLPFMRRTEFATVFNAVIRKIPGLPRK